MQKTVTLQSPASLILLYLIQHNNTVVSQNQLITAGWGEKNHVTSANTFYQTILILRNALSDIGLPRDLIKTIARRGMMISANIQTDEITTKASATEAPVQIVAPQMEPKGDTPIKKRHLLLPAALCGLALLVVMISIAASLFYMSPESLLSSYEVLDSETFSSCTVLQKGNDVLELNYIRFMHKHREICDNNSYVFLSGMSSAKNITAIICPEDARENPFVKCITYYSINDEN
ncbi:hypothetical protein DNK65_04430 [Citrobacter koseri]|uniref:winged helix-turn-helix domain-containing protein n=1 Tax=Citrobacter koseri TaxID=545 RepID=UPI000D7BA8CC|nr:winged helix-turn-helix domain-containing protein [Citrobacter koseri]PYZ77560.1 hypothetical protein DNK65_04430 [Citrobacter koseri]